MTIDATTYPLPRRKRVGPDSQLNTLAQAQGDVIPAPPRSRIFPWIMSMTANTRRTISTPKLIGPAILRKVFYQLGTVTTPPGQTLELGWSPTAVSEAGVALTTVRPYTVLTELLDPFGVANAAVGKGLLDTSLWNTNIPYEWSVDLIVTEPQFCFTLSWINNVATAEQRGGQLLVLENVSPDALSVFTGS